ncbi:hypothetical protein BS50DRAFT_265998 [Corynespora cassiicola Philippines]|uniref:Uncharacterized protein n=1 Tax=Corynespora cassiicola Philippines TaxID=1448308 RepID=A0A2T2NZ13_CORCC|nr:hypothetical protein BS50DRAFT_265998 [Corynespora cassiicola Philippines]
MSPRSPCLPRSPMANTQTLSRAEPRRRHPQAKSASRHAKHVQAKINITPKFPFQEHLGEIEDLHSPLGSHLPPSPSPSNKCLRLISISAQRLFWSAGKGMGVPTRLTAQVATQRNATHSPVPKHHRRASSPPPPPSTPVDTHKRPLMPPNV